ncbi:MAG: hypothetical protein O3C63_04450 [Cyanobacteria bacterium]|nr:hypothetical protein [Cyanobacteriota bacterium]MDA1020768.1 hypothetical protein [Cyanobacteriota bacterium]
MASLGKVFQGIKGARGGSASSGDKKTTGRAIASVSGSSEDKKLIRQTEQLKSQTQKLVKLVKLTLGKIQLQSLMNFKTMQQLPNFWTLMHHFVVFQ